MVAFSRRQGPGLCAVIAALACAVPAAADNVEQWGMKEITLTSAKSYANPFADVQLQGEFRCAGKVTSVAGFYDGAGRWKIRFMPETQGNCRFLTRSGDRALDHVAGHFTVTAPAANNHGPVRPAHVWHFSHADGTPYFLLGTTSYNWLNRDPALQDQTLATLAGTGFTKIRFALFPKWYQFNRVEPSVFPYERKADGQFDLDRFDPRFFANVEARIRQLQALGIEADVILFHPYDNWGFSRMDEAHNLAWLHYVTARLAAFRNVWWTMANEYDLMPARDWDRLGMAVRAGDPFDHPLGIHNFGAWYHPEHAWIDHVIIQDGFGSAGRSVAVSRLRYHKPAVVDEFGYEGDNGNGWGDLTGPQELSRMWDIVMAGGYGSHGETYVHPGGVQWWGAGGVLVGDSPTRLAFLKAVMTALPFQTMDPAPGLVTGGSALAAPGRAYLFRFPPPTAPMASPRHQIRLAGAPLFKVELIDPWQMTVTPLGYTGAGDQAFALPVAPALLRITAAPADAGKPEALGSLIARYLNEPAQHWTVDPALFRADPLTYSDDFQIGQLIADPAARALLERDAPAAKLSGMMAAFPLNAANQFLKIPPGKMDALRTALARMPVR
ncbi:MAG: DUF5060 domain-containing protein [Sphingomonadales bacterium]|nr:DUF5060 domain-containing protein [Sphingomonadales bacterium]